MYASLYMLKVIQLFIYKLYKLKLNYATQVNTVCLNYYFPEQISLLYNKVYN